MRFPALAIVLAAVLSGSAEESNKVHIALSKLKGEGVEDATVRVISNRLRSELFRTGAFTVVERGQMNEILKEQGFQQAGCTSDACVVEVGQILGVERMIAGSLGKVGSLYTLNLRTIDVATARIEHTISVDCRCPVEDVLTKSTVDAAQRLSAAMSGTQPPPLLSSAESEAQRGDRAVKRDAEQGKKRRTWPKWLFGSLAVVSGGCGIIMDNLVGQRVDEINQVESDYKQYVSETGTDDRYEDFNNDYTNLYSAAESNATIRNILYGAAGASAVAFGVSFFF